MLDVIESLESPQEDSETLSEQVFRRIQAAIVKGEIAPGSKISEPELARTYGISRGPLREAIHRLEGQRLLVRVPHIGARVVSLSHAELIELYEIRESLEGMACRLAAERMTAALDTGGVFINGYCASDPRVAFGGVKKSGFGRELSHFGVREFCNAQTVWLDRN